MILPLAWMPGPMEWIIIAVVALVLFGRRLPEVGRSLAQGIVEFKRGLKGIESDVDEAVKKEPARREEPSKPEVTSSHP